MSRPIIVVTGANNGIGFGICRRLLFELALSAPADAQPFFPRTNSLDVGISYPCEGATIIMACRNREKAEAARLDLLKLFDKDVADSTVHQDDPHVARFRKNMQIDIHRLDLASVRSILDCCEGLRRAYPYISHIICNAGVAPFHSINWLKLAKQIATDPLGALTYPEFNNQISGAVSIDGLGLIWQCNVFGHYMLVRALESKLEASTSRTAGPGRVIWQSSLEALPQYFVAEDWQLTKTKDPYHASKYHMDLISGELNHRALHRHPQRVRHVLVEPGVAHTSIDVLLLSTFMHYVKHVIFYLARFIGSKHHNISTWNGAAAAVHAVLVSAAFLPAFVTTGTNRLLRDDEASVSQVYPTNVAPAKLQSVTTVMQGNSVHVSGVREWPAHATEARLLVDRYEELYQSYISDKGRLS